MVESGCVKSYSYLSNRASIESPKIRKRQEYSYEETLTNITYLNRPVCRRVITVNGVFSRTLGSYPEIDFFSS